MLCRCCHLQLTHTHKAIQQTYIVIRCTFIYILVNVYISICFVELPNLLALVLKIFSLVVSRTTTLGIMGIANLQFYFTLRPRDKKFFCKKQIEHISVGHQNSAHLVVCCWIRSIYLFKIFISCKNEINNK